ncbi:arginase [Ammoniphilus sp. 3BR4]|uniref:arginase n=1 Tax=Ammoniphilus sp. 3BR4 TaxID=3158265 RepID=UPI00346593FD
MKTISLVSVPFDLGAGKRGVNQGPEGLLSEGLADLLKGLDVDIRNHKVLNRIEPFLGTNDSHMKNYREVLEINRQLAECISEIMSSDDFPLILGGDHSIAIGTIAGLAQRYKRLGVIWIDAHGDVNTPYTSPSGNIHGMSLAASLGFGDPVLTGLGGITPKIKTENVVIIGARDLDPEEKRFIREHNITCYTMHDIDELGMAKVMKEAIHIVSQETDGVHLSFDIDSVDPIEAPGTGTPVKGGLNYREAHLAMEILHQSGILTSAEFVEVNPSLDDEDRKTSKIAVELIESLFGKRII